mgnify:CR=1 FL=1
MKSIKELWQKTPAIIKNKYTLTLFIFFVWLLFFDSNNLMHRISNINTIRKLENEKEYYEEKIRKDSTQLETLRTDPNEIEKIGREKYFMKKNDEEIFVIEKK